MLEDKNEIVSSDNESALPALVDLNDESKALIGQIIAEKDTQKSKELTQLFNANQNKKTMIRIDKLSDLQDNLVDQFARRISERPDEISNKELMDGIKIVQDIIERGQKQVSIAGETPLIQINQQTNEVNLGGHGENLSRDSRERVKSAVMNLLTSITQANPIVTATEINTFEEDAVIVEDTENE